MIKKIIRITSRSLLFIMLSGFAITAQAFNNILDKIEVQQSQDQSVIKISFTERLVYRSHAPKDEADLIHIDINFLGIDATTFRDQEFLTWKPTKTVPLYEASLEPMSSSQGDLVLRFNNTVKFDVQGSADSYSILITVYHPQAGEAISLPDITVTDTIQALPEYQNTPENQVLAQLMEEARQAMAKQDYENAIKLYTKVLASDQSVFAKQALEYLGVAREKRKQLAHAKKLYEQYLKRYPEGEDAERVRQRLLAMITSTDTPKEKLREVAKQERDKPEWDYFGGFSQFYNNNVSLMDVSGRRVTQDELRSDLDFSIRRRSENMDLSARFTGGHTANFLSNGKEDEKRLSSFYFDLKDKVRGFSGRLGRQTRTSGGVLGRFDGLFADYQFAEKYKINFVAGYPVDSSRDVRIISEREFYGVSLDMGTFNNAWDFNLFAINQDNQGFTDRRAIGGEVRYFDAKQSLFTLIDYDVFYHKLNLLLFNGRWNLTPAMTFNVNYDYRTSPILTTRNALTGQTVTHLEQLLQIFPKSTIYQLAEDRTADSHMLFTGLTYQINEQFQISGDARLSKYSSTSASGGVLAVDGTKLEKEFSTQLTGNSLLKENDLLILSATYSDLTTSNVVTLNINARYPVTRDFLINPRLRYRYRDVQTTGATQVTYSPSIEFTYRIRRYLQLEAEIAADWEYTKLAGTTDRARNFFFLIGYRYDF